jgi:hypothetical protein
MNFTPERASYLPFIKRHIRMRPIPAILLPEPVIPQSPYALILLHFTFGVFTLEIVTAKCKTLHAECKSNAPIQKP